MKFTEQVASKLPKGLVSEQVIIEHIEIVTIAILEEMGTSKEGARKKMRFLGSVDQDFLSDVLSEYKSL